MTLIINETGERKDLTCIIDGIDCAQDIIGNSGAIGGYIVYDNDAEVYRISQDDYDWWDEYLTHYREDYEAICELKSEYGAEAVDEIVNDEREYDNDYDDHHRTNERIMERVRAELRPLS